MGVHASLTDPELHEPKGASTASANTVYRANGSGGGSWGLIKAENVDTSSVYFNFNLVDAHMADIGTVNTVYVPIPWACQVTGVYAVLQAAITGANTTVTIANNAGTTMGTLTFPVAGSAPGYTAYNYALTNNTFSDFQVLRITTDGAASNSVPVIFSIEVTFN